MSTAALNGNGRPTHTAVRISRHGLTAEISLSGELDLADRAALHRAVAQALAERPAEVLLVDMTDVTFFDSSVAHWLLEAQRHASAAGTRVVAVVADREAGDVLELLGVTGEMTVVDGR